MDRLRGRRVVHGAHGRAWNTVIGQVVLNGSVVSGYLSGAQVHEEGHLVDPATLTFAGSLQLMPASAG